MNTRLSFLLLTFLILVSCVDDEKIGNCIACCDVDGDQICYSGFTDNRCSEYNKKKVDGYEWKFTETSLPCPPIPN